VLFLEWAGGRNLDLAGQAIAEGLRSHLLPPGVVSPLPTGSAGFKNQLATGLTYTLANAATLTFEYDYNQAAFSAADWRRWFDTGRAAPASAELLWLVRSFAQDRQDPVSRDSLFARLDWPNAFVPRLELSAFSSVSLDDGSALVQAQATYPLGSHWSLGGLVIGDVGRARSGGGSLPNALTARFRLTRYF
jgi:hypothetical protein